MEKDENKIGELQAEVEVLGQLMNFLKTIRCGRRLELVAPASRLEVRLKTERARLQRKINRKK